VLKPATTKQVADIVRLAAHQGIGIVPQGGNTSYCGGATPDASGRQIVVSLERMDRIREVDPVSMSISVDAGAILKNVQDAAETAGLLLPLSLGRWCLGFFFPVHACGFPSAGQRPSDRPTDWSCTGFWRSNLYF
jgi:FAD/FMN-containing dehydrogenase